MSKNSGMETLKDLNVCSQKGLVEMFDGSIGAASVFMPHGGQVSDDRDTGYGCKASGTDRRLRYGYYDELSDSIRICPTWSPYHGAIYAVTESVAKIVAAGGDYK